MAILIPTLLQKLTRQMTIYRKNKATVTYSLDFARFDAWLLEE